MANLAWSTTKRPTDGGICFCCRRRDNGIGYLKTATPLRIIWSCDDHILLVRKALAMAQPIFDVYEKQAIEEAGIVGGRMLSDIFNETDLAKLTPEQYKEYCETIVRAFGRSLATRLTNHTEAPF